MYTIIKEPDGKFYCLAGLQDDTERWTCETLKEAVRSMKKFAAHEQNIIKKRNIVFLQEVRETVTQTVHWKP